jgi:alanine racemase
MTRPARALIDLQALRHNLSLAREAASGAKVMAVVKANAYGHGLLSAARALDQADAFGVARLAEGLALRTAGTKAPVVLLSGVESGGDLEEARRRRLDIVVHSEHQIAMLEAAPPGPRLKAWLKLDTGMHRLGFPPALLERNYARLSKCDAVVDSVVLMTHLADADVVKSRRVGEQLRLFEAVTRGTSAERSIANSGGLLAWEDARADWVRPGIMLYGISPFAGATGADHGLLSAMTVETRLIAVNRAESGDRIGYGGSYTCDDPMRIGVAAIGYGDGYPRHAPSGTPVLVEGVRCPLAGRVSMDLITIDLRPNVEAKVGDRVVLWGEGLPAEEVAAHAGTIAYELVCRLAPRVVYVELDP